MIQVHVRARLTEGKGVMDDLKRRFEQGFLPVISRQEGFVACELLADRDTPVWIEVRIAFTDEGLRMQWVNSAAHQAAWPRLGELFAETEVRRYDVLTGLC